MMLPKIHARGSLFCILALFFLIVLYKLGTVCNTGKSSTKPFTKYVAELSDRKMNSHGRNASLIFISGMPQSGTSLMRIMLDAHPLVRCGQETRMILDLMRKKKKWKSSKKESTRLIQAGITKDVHALQIIDAALAALILEIVIKQGEPAPRLCSKEATLIKEGSCMREVFPNCKFIFMVRDGRAVVHSLISRQITVPGFDLTSYRKLLTVWNKQISEMHEQCEDIGPEGCLVVQYEQLVTNPRKWMRKVLEFLEISWSEAVLHYKEHINRSSSVILNNLSDQITKKNLEGLTEWEGKIPKDVVKDMARLAPMLSVLGYNPLLNPPIYGEPDEKADDKLR